MRIPLARPSLTACELSAVEDVFASGWLGEGAWTTDFERTIADYTQAGHVVAVNTGTSALHLALEVLGVGPGDEVILPALTFASDPMAVRLCGATPVFADIDERTLNLDPRDVEARITTRTRAVVPTDYAGLSADIPAIRQGIGPRDIRIVRDAAHSFGSCVDGRPIGVWCGEHATCFSFDPIKNLTCGEGGAVLVNDAGMAETMRVKKTLGLKARARTRSPGSAALVRGVVTTGYRYHMSNINAAIGLAQFHRLHELIERKRTVARAYDERLAGCPCVRIFARDYDAVAPFIYPVRVDPLQRDGLIAHFAEQGIHADLRYSPCHQEPLFDAGRRLPVTEALTRELLCLPIYADLSLEDIDEIVSTLTHYLMAIAPGRRGGR